MGLLSNKDNEYNADKILNDMLEEFDLDLNEDEKDKDTKNKKTKSED